MATLLLARHGETQFNVDDRMQGRLDVPLSSNGCRQAQILAEHLASGRGPGGSAALTRIISSPQVRAMATARAVAERCGLSVESDNRLMEIDVGRLSGLTRGEARAQEPGFFLRWTVDAGSTRYPGGESAEDVLARATSFLDDMWAKLGPSDTVLVVAHAVVLKCMVIATLRSDVSHYPRIVLRNASLSAIKLDAGGPHVDFVNATHHLDGASLAEDRDCQRSRGHSR